MITLSAAMHDLWDRCYYAHESHAGCHLAWRGKWWDSSRSSFVGFKGFFLWNPPLGNFPSPPQLLQRDMPVILWSSLPSKGLSKPICGTTVLAKAFSQLGRLLFALRLSSWSEDEIDCLDIYNIRRDSAICEYRAEPWRDLESRDHHDLAHICTHAWS